MKTTERTMVLECCDIAIASGVAILCQLLLLTRVITLSRFVFTSNKKHLKKKSFSIFFKVEVHLYCLDKSIISLWSMQLYIVLDEFLFHSFKMQTSYSLAHFPLNRCQWNVHGHTITYKIWSQIRMVNFNAIIHHSDENSFSRITGIPCRPHIHRNRCATLKTNSIFVVIWSLLLTINREFMEVRISVSEWHIWCFHY